MARPPSRRELAALAAELRAFHAAQAEGGEEWLLMEDPSPAARLAPPPPPRRRPSPAAPPPEAAAPPEGVRRPLPSLSRAARESVLAAVAGEVAACTACGLCRGRTLTVPGEGDPEAAVMFVGEGPGEQEDLSGRPFVGRAGQLLRRLIREELGREPEQVFIANIVKCRPPGNRAPQPDETAACLPFLRRQVAAVRPRVLVPLGNPATQALLQTREGITRLRGRPVRRGEFLFLPTYHPSYLLRNPAAEPEGRADFRTLRTLLDAP